MITNPDFNKITLTRIAGGFLATNSTGHVGGGNTIAEALGHLVLTCPDMFDITSIEYASKDSATRLYVIERGLNQKIV